MTENQIAIIKRAITNLIAIGRMEDMNGQNNRETLGGIELDLERLLPAEMQPFIPDEVIIKEIMGDEYEDYEDEDEDRLFECPLCHTLDSDNTSIKDRGRCYACHKRWQNGELEDEDDEFCPTCDGEGTVGHEYDDGRSDCPDCGGSGKAR